MKSLILFLFALTLISSAFAQRRDQHRPRGPRYNPPDRVDPRYPDPRYNPHYPGPGQDRVIIIEPVNRYNSRRVIRTTRRAPITWSRFGYSCQNSKLQLNGRVMHRFWNSSDCLTALKDIAHYGDYCDRGDLYDQSGVLEARFRSNYDCRNALGWYY